MTIFFERYKNSSEWFDNVFVLNYTIHILVILHCMRTQIPKYVNEYVSTWICIFNEPELGEQPQTKILDAPLAASGVTRGEQKGGSFARALQVRGAKQPHRNIS